MTPIILIDQLVLFIQSVVSEFDLETNVPGVRKQPQVVAGYLREKKTAQKQEVPDFPHVVVRFLEDTDALESNTAHVRIIAGTYSQDEQNGWRDAMNVITRIKQALIKQRIIGNIFIMEKPIKTDLPEEQPFPEWVAMMTVNFTIPQIQEEGGILDVLG